MFFQRITGRSPVGLPGPASSRSQVLREVSLDDTQLSVLQAAAEATVSPRARLEPVHRRISKPPVYAPGLKKQGPRSANRQATIVGRRSPPKAEARRSALAKAGEGGRASSAYFLLTAVESIRTSRVWPRE
jgi:hypothetical protein